MSRSTASCPTFPTDTHGCNKIMLVYISVNLNDHVLGCKIYSFQCASCTLKLKKEELNSKRKSELADVEKRVSKDSQAIESKGKLDASSVENISADKRQKAMDAVVERLLEV